jgi:hypothetical protein
LEFELELKIELGRAKEELGDLRRREKGKRQNSFAIVKLAVLSVIFIDFVGCWVCVGDRLLDQPIRVV